MAALSEVRLIVEFAAAKDAYITRADVHDLLVELVGDWAMQAPNERVVTTGTFDPGGEKLHDREIIIDTVCAKEDIGTHERV